jgi:hypothetical protein
MKADGDDEASYKNVMQMMTMMMVIIIIIIIIIRNTSRGRIRVSSDFRSVFFLTK